MTISHDDRQRVLEMLDQRPTDDPDATGEAFDAAMRSLLNDISVVVPDASMADIHGVLEEHEERLRDRVERHTGQADQMQFIQSVARRDPDLKFLRGNPRFEKLVADKEER